MSRRKLYHDRGMTPAKVAALYSEAGSLAEAAVLAGVSRKTFWEWTRLAGMRLERGKPPVNRHHRGALPRWIRAHPGEVLPISPTRISRLTGASIDAVKSYLKRRRHEMIDWARGLPDLRDIKGVSLLTTEGYALPLLAIRSYTLSVPRLKVRIAGTLRSGRHFTIATTREALDAALDR